jgi:molecular chaperone GrpE
VATKKRSTRAGSRPAPGPTSFDDDLGFPEEELEKLFADALAEDAPPKPAADGRPKGAARQTAPELADLDLDLGDLEAALHSGFDAVSDVDDASGEFDELDRELARALADDDDEDDEDLAASMKRLLAESMGPTHLLDDDDDDLPEVDAVPVEEILGLGDDGAIEFPDERAVEVARLRSRIHELERATALASLELRTKDDRVETLEQQVIAATRQSANVTREFESFRRRAEREREDLRKFAAEKVLKEFLGVYDNLGRALAHAGGARETALGEGVHMILGQFSGALRRCGVEEHPSEPGDPFDPQWHEAVGQEHSEYPEGRIVRRMHAGFALNDRLLRAAMVTVSRGPGGPAGEVVATDPNVPAVLVPEPEAAEEPPPESKKKARRSKKAHKE